MSENHRSAWWVKALRVCAWGLFIAWAGFWLFFNIASGIGEIGELGAMGLIMHLIMPALILLAGYLAWRSELLGGLMLIGAVAVFTMWFGWPDWVLALILDAPALLAGILMLVVWRGARLHDAGGPEMNAEVGP